MTTPTEVTPPENLLRRIHLFKGLETLPLPWQDGEQPLLAWLDCLPPPSEDDEPALGMEVREDGQAVVWHAHGPTQLMIPQLQQWLPQDSTDHTELQHIATAGALLQPHRLGLWVRQDGDEQHKGWFFPVRRPLADLRAWLEGGESSKLLLSWAKTWEVTHGSMLRRCVGPGTAYSEVDFALPGRDADAQLSALDGFCDTVSIPRLMDDLATLLRERGRAGLSLRVRMTEKGMTGASLRVPQPDAELTGILLGGPKALPHEAWATLESALGARGPEHVELVFTVGVPTAVLHYKAGDASSDEMRTKVVKEALAMAEAAKDR